MLLLLAKARDSEKKATFEVGGARIGTLAAHFTAYLAA